MMESRRMELLVDLAWIIFAGSYCLVASTYPPGGRMVPLTFGIITLIVGLAHASGNFIAFVRPFTHGDTEAVERDIVIERSELKAALWAAALLGGVFLIGTLAAIFLFFLVYFGIRGRRWGVGLISGLLMALVAWGLFGQLISLPLPQGVVAPFILHWF
jgi:Tripartite tricarboxylate transporter TctB family